MRRAGILDNLVNELDCAIRTLLPPSLRITTRPSPARQIEDIPLRANEKKHIAGLMRVNHSGEVCAQALYQGQALTARLSHVKKQMAQAAAEEVDHLAWCEERLYELGYKTSRLNLFWYTGSLLIGAFAGLAGDKISLGFVAETERQVTAHLQRHLNDIPQNDAKTKAILKLMQEDEEHHASVAIQAGAIELPFFIKQTMSLVSKLMTQSSYYF